uniref:Cytochrome c biogenesis protein CcsA n=1 Tax=Pedinomonas minor TaxID=3159 RepID=C7BES5_PEDMN|nr:heme attachment to plastid cytochrome c [Pedinomonas minor]ACQ90832.1 heme attachment to plastid cytochrome c [Pedinomonas minor]
MFTITTNLLSNLTFVSLFVNCLVAWISYIFQNKKDQLLILFNLLSLTLSSVFFLERWQESGHFPISNLYESLIFLSFIINVGILWLYKLTNNVLLYCISSPAPLLINAFASFALSSTLQKSSPLIPALKSNWLLMHVTVMIISYATLILGSLLAIAFLILALISFNSTKQANAKLTSTANFTSFNFELIEQTSNSQLFNFLKNLDNLSYRFIGISFPFLTIGIISGAVWANETWGSYWNWDPKETWALITWLVFAIYLHFRLIKGLEGVVPSIIASLGFLVVWICYLGVNLLGKGLHSYGFFN